MADDYVDYMTRHASDAQRLDEQFDIFTTNIGYLLHPTIEASLPTTPVIADVATGTGRFLVQLQERFPDGIFEGTDISDASFPPGIDETSSLRSKNISLSLLDIKQPVPASLQGRYDAVHVRMLVAGMQPDDWAPAVANLSRMLKPGGYLQWTECDFLTLKHLRNNADSRVEHIRALGRSFGSVLRDRFSHGWNTLPGLMQSEGGLENVFVDIVSSDRISETRHRSTVNSVLAPLSSLRQMAKRGHPGTKTEGEIDELERNVLGDIQSGAYVRYDIHVTCGRKPLAEA